MAVAMRVLLMREARLSSQNDWIKIVVTRGPQDMCVLALLTPSSAIFRREA